MSRQRPKLRRKAARRPWWRPLVGLGLLAGWLAVSERGRQAVKTAKEQASKARQKLAVAPPGPVLAEVTALPRTTTAATRSQGRSRTPRRRPRRRNRPRSSAAASGQGGSRRR